VLKTVSKIVTQNVLVSGRNYDHGVYAFNYAWQCVSFLKMVKTTQDAANNNLMI